MKLRHKSGQGEFDLVNVRALVCRLGSRRDYGAWLEFYSPLSSRGVVVERNGVTAIKVPAVSGNLVDLFGGAL